MNQTIQWEAFAESYAGTSDLMLAEVAISEHGDNSNAELATRFAIDKEKYPEFRLFMASQKVDDALVYQYEDKLVGDDLAQFVRGNGVYLALAGCLKEYDHLVEQFMKAQTSPEKDEIGKMGKNALEKYAENEVEHKSAKYYMKVMSRIVKDDDDGYVVKERERLSNLLNGDTYIADDKKPWFSKRINILNQFKQYVDGQDKPEL